MKLGRIAPLAALKLYSKYETVVLWPLGRIAPLAALKRSRTADDLDREPLGRVAPLAALKLPVVTAAWRYIQEVRKDCAACGIETFLTVTRCDPFFLKLQRIAPLAALKPLLTMLQNAERSFEIIAPLAALKLSPKQSQLFF